MTEKSEALLMAKAMQAVVSARALLELPDTDGACNRAYYAMFDAAQAALLAAKVPAGDAVGKTHRGLIQAFSAHLVKGGTVSKELGRQLKRAEETRWVADYGGRSVDLPQATELVAQAEAFVAAMRDLVRPDLSAAPLPPPA